MQCSEGLQSYQIVHDTSCIAVMGAKVKSAEHWVFDFLVSQTNMLLHIGVLDANWLGEVSEDIRVGQIELR